MKLPPFDLVTPRTLDDALALLAERGRPAVPLAGGQTLLPLLATGVVEATTLVDLGRLERTAGLHGMDVEGTRVRIGALVTHAELLRSAPVRVLRDAATRIGTAAVRTRGTIGGSLAAAASAAEWCVAAVALDAEIHVASIEGVRRIGARSLFMDPDALAVDRPAPGELLTSVEMKVPARAGIAGHRDRVDGAATVVAAALVALEDGASELRVAAGGIGPAPRLSLLRVEADDMTPHGVSVRAAREIVRGLRSRSDGDDLARALAVRAMERMTP